MVHIFDDILYHFYYIFSLNVKKLFSYCRKIEPDLDNKIIIDGIYFVLFQNKAKLVTYVIASGLTYGAEESIFHYLFKVTVSLTL